MDALSFVLPLLLLLGVIFLIARYQMRSYGKHVERVENINDELVSLNRQIVVELREIKEILRDRN